MTTFRLRAEAQGEHVLARVSAGPDAEHLALAGVIRLRAGEWAALEGVLTVGSEGSPVTVEIHHTDSSTKEN
jgi:hypothetical protein